MKQVENALKLRNLSKTRWVYRNESIEAVWNSFEAIRKGLTEVTEKDNNETTNFRCPLQCQINMNLVFHISEDGSKIELKHCASLKTSVKSSRKCFVHLNWIRLASNASWLYSSIGRAAV